MHLPFPCFHTYLTLQAPTALISRLMITLDGTRRIEIRPQLIGAVGLTPMPPDGNSNIVHQALLGAVYAYSARWLLVDNAESRSTSPKNAWKMKEDLLRYLWAQAYQKIQPAMTRPSYTSILALHLFGSTPTASQSEERRVTEMCLGIALQHYATMSVRTGFMSRVSKPAGRSSIDMDRPQAPDIAAMEFAQMEDTAHWFGIICDTSRSLIGCQPSILLPSNTESKVWRSVRQEISDFQQRARSEHWRDSQLPLSIERLYSIVGNGSACRAMVWSAISKVQEALFHNMTDISVEGATHHALQELDRFNEIFGCLVGICRRDFVLLNEKIRISCCRFSVCFDTSVTVNLVIALLDIEFGLGVLTLVDTLCATSNAHLLPSEYELRIISARGIVNAVNLVLHTDHYSSGNHASNSNLLQIPYPEHVINALSRAGSSLVHLYRTNFVSASMVEVMFCVIFTGLETLQTISYSAEEALEILLPLCNDCGLRPKTYQDSSAAMDPWNTISPAVGLALHDKTFLKKLDEHLNIDPGLINSTIERHEVALSVL